MNRSYLSLALLLSCAASSSIFAMQTGGPMNAERFYAADNPFKSANDLYQNQQWKEAVNEYRRLLVESKDVSEYDRDQARVNCASCCMALGFPSSQWGGYDALAGIPAAKRITRAAIVNKAVEKKSVLVKTDTVGIGDIFHFIETVAELKDQTGANITLSVRPFLKLAFEKFAQDEEIALISDKDAQPETDYVTHIVGLLGHLKLAPGLLEPERALFTAPDEAMGKVKDLLAPRLEAGNMVLAVFLGENRQATLIGGKQLPRDPKAHGRHLDSKPFVSLLKKYPKLMLLDCGTKDSKVAVDQDQKERVMDIPADKGFDTFVALGRYMSAADQGSMVAMGADNGPTNVVARCLDDATQDYMAIIIPNGSEHDMRMNGEGKKYKQMLSNCWVYRCDTPEDQELVIAQAYADMTSQD